jgi:hypothetical protein
LTTEGDREEKNLIDENNNNLKVGFSNWIFI